MKIEDIPCPPPSGFKSGEYSTESSNDVAGPPYRVPWGKEGGHLKNATGEVIDSIWGVPVGRREISQEKSHRGGKY